MVELVHLLSTAEKRLRSVFVTPHNLGPNMKVSVFQDVRHFNFNKWLPCANKTHSVCYYVDISCWGLNQCMHNHYG